MRDRPGFLPKSQWVLPFFQTAVILSELGPQRLFAILEMEDEQVSLATYSLLQVMFDALKEGLQRDVRGKEEAVVLGESLGCLPDGLSIYFVSCQAHLCADALGGAGLRMLAWSRGGSDLLNSDSSPVDTSKELKLLLKQLLEALTRESISSYGRDSILNLLISVVPRKSLKDPNNCLTLWVIDQGMSSPFPSPSSSWPGSLASASEHVCPH